MQVRDVPIRPFQDQRPGTSGLRRKLTVFRQSHYLEAYLQAVLEEVRALSLRAGGHHPLTLVIGGDGRLFNREAITRAVGMAAASGFQKTIIGRGGILSTPAASHIIRQRRADAGLIFSASHNPAGLSGDFGVKLNLANGGPAPETVTEAIFHRSRQLEHYHILEPLPDLPLETPGSFTLGELQVEIIDPVTDYAALMEGLFDFGKIRQLLHDGFRFVFDGMHAVTGPYAEEIFVHRLGALQDDMRRTEIKPDFGGLHPDPNPYDLADLAHEMMTANAPDLAAASDGDGDRNLVMGKGIIVSPSDALAILADQARLIPAFTDGLKGVARSMPTSRAIDQVAAFHGYPCYETPTGWKYFGTLLDAGLITLCGEESAGVGGDHIREKDGLWAVLFWLNIMAERRQPLRDIVTGHWQRFGRHYYCRCDYEHLNPEQAAKAIDSLREMIPHFEGANFAGCIITAADDFTYTDPVDGSHADHQGLRFLFGPAQRAVIRLSGTGTEGAILRLYLEQYEPVRVLEEPDLILMPFLRQMDDLLGLSQITGKSAPDRIS